MRRITRPKADRRHRRILRRAKQAWRPSNRRVARFDVRYGFSVFQPDWQVIVHEE